MIVSMVEVAEQRSIKKALSYNVIIIIIIIIFLIIIIIIIFFLNFRRVFSKVVL